MGKLILRHTFTRNLLYYCLILPIKRHQGPLHKGHQFWPSCHNLRQWDANRPVQGRFPQNEMSICCRDQWKKPILYRNCLLALRKTSTYTCANIRICKVRIIFMKVERHWSSFHQSRYVDLSYPSIHPSIHECIYLKVYIISLCCFRNLSTWLSLFMRSSIYLLFMYTRTMQDTYSGFHKFLYIQNSSNIVVRSLSKLTTSVLLEKTKLETQSIDLNPLWVAPLH